jgi:CBS domain-containing protein
MDGGRVLRALLAMRMGYARATNIAATVGQGMAILFALASWWTTPMLLFIALFVWIGAGQEASATEMKTSLSGARVRDAMLTEFRVLSPASTLAEAARMLLAGSQQDFPVVQDGELVGLVPRSVLLKGLREIGESAPISSIMAQDIEVLQPHEMLEAALGRANSEGALAMPVVEHGQLIGLLTAENIGEYFMIRSALGNRGRAGGPPPLPRGARVPPIIVRERA